MPCNPIPIPEPDNRAAVSPMSPRSIVDLIRTRRATQPSSSSPASICRNTSPTVSPHRVSQTVRPNAGESPMHTSRIAALERRLDVSADDVTAVLGLVGRQLRTCARLPDVVDLGTPFLGERVAGAGSA